MELPAIGWFYFYLGLAGCPLLLILNFFGDRIEALSKRLEEEEEEEGREERNRVWIEQQNSQAAQRDRLRELANAEIERLWRIKQSR
jgi:ferric iron reductase protein FhuF